MRIAFFDPQTATEDEWDAYHRLHAQMDREYHPDDTPRSREELQLEWRNLPPDLAVHRWGLWDGDQAVGRGGVWIWTQETNQHLASFNIYVLPAYRRQGHGRALLSLAVEPARQAQRTLLMTQTSSQLPDGEGFMRHIGAAPGLQQRESQLLIADVDRALVNHWQTEGPLHAPGFALEFVNGPYPEPDLDAICRVLDAMNDAPRGDLDLEDWRQTPQRLRRWEENNAIRGFVRWTVFARDLATGTLAGWTEVLYNPRQPTLLFQLGTGVLPEYRGRRLGRWMKAAMLERVMADMPQVTRIRTGNAVTNAYMLDINIALGFKPYQIETVWQVPTDKVAAYVGG